MIRLYTHLIIAASATEDEQKSVGGPVSDSDLCLGRPFPTSPQIVATHSLELLAKFIFGLGHFIFRVPGN